MKQLPQNFSNSAIEKAINEWVQGRHADRNRKILKDRLINGMCFDPLAEKYDISIRQAQNIVYKTQEQVFKHLTKSK